MNQIAWRYHWRIEHGSPLLGLLDTPYEEYVLVFALGCVLAMRGPYRTTWMLLGCVIAGHLVASGFWLGPIPRYAIPAHPLMHIFEALALVQIVRALASVGRFVRSPNLVTRIAAHPSHS